MNEIRLQEMHNIKRFETAKSTILDGLWQMVFLFFLTFVLIFKQFLFLHNHILTHTTNIHAFLIVTKLYCTHVRTFLTRCAEDKREARI